MVSFAAFVSLSDDRIDWYSNTDGDSSVVDFSDEEKQHQSILETLKYSSVRAINKI